MMTITLLYMIVYVSPTNGLQCMTEDNKEVDWFVAYKLPEIKHTHKLIEGGLAYTFMTSEDYSSWQLSNLSINDTNCLIANTLSPLYNNPEDYFYVLYNDQPPQSESKTDKGHNKGVIIANEQGGIWLIHSVPHFPSLGKGYSFPRTGSVFGQSFLCISLDLKTLNDIGIQLQYNEPQIYETNILNKLRTEIPNLTDAASNKTVLNSPWFRVTDIVSKRGIQFTSFAKSKNFGKELYEDLVAPALNTDLFVETWPNGEGKLPSNCSKPFKVNNVASVSILVANVTFKNTHDHSKWAVSEDLSKNCWICIGDINRMEHQKVRGGGTVCMNNKKLATNYQKCVQNFESCKKLT